MGAKRLGSTPMLLQHKPTSIIPEQKMKPVSGCHISDDEGKLKTDAGKAPPYLKYRRRLPACLEWLQKQAKDPQASTQILCRDIIMINFYDYRHRRYRPWAKCRSLQIREDLPSFTSCLL